jgi:hypothetical protein
VALPAFGQIPSSVPGGTKAYPPQHHTNARLPSIGRPIAGARIHILDEHGHPVHEGEMGEIHIGGADFVLGSAPFHPHDLVLGYYSVHTSPSSLQKGEQQIAKIEARLRQDGRL